ncbi:MAG TPA: alpha/beta hydrolase [Acidimicrobiales bacterium]|nr:alpha/beta hydrolase [Acidimicrobiales bacterium]
MATLERPGVRLHYDVVGDGPAILFVHSATSAGNHEWRTLVDDLSGRYRCIVPDLRGHGQSDHGAGTLGLDQILDDLRALLAHEHIVRPHVVGFSFGAEAALELEVRDPGTVSSLILVSPSIGHPTGVPRSEQIATGWPRSLRDLHEAKHGPEQWRTILETLSADAATRSQIPDEVLSAIGCRMLLVAGSEDQRIRVAQARHLAELNHRARLVVVPGAGHAAHAAEPKLFAEEVTAFLAETAAGTSAKEAKRCQ